MSKAKSRRDHGPTQRNLICSRHIFYNVGCFNTIIYIIWTTNLVTCIGRIYKKEEFILFSNSIYLGHLLSKAAWGPLQFLHFFKSHSHSEVRWLLPHFPQVVLPLQLEAVCPNELQLKHRVGCLSWTNLSHVRKRESIKTPFSKMASKSVVASNATWITCNAVPFLINRLTDLQELYTPILFRNTI